MLTVIHVVSRPDRPRPEAVLRPGFPKGPVCVRRAMTRVERTAAPGRCPGSERRGDLLRRPRALVHRGLDPHNLREAPPELHLPRDHGGVEVRLPRRDLPPDLPRGLELEVRGVLRLGRVTRDGPPGALDPWA